MSLLARLQQMNSDASVLETSSVIICNKIKNVQPFEGPGLERNLRKLETDAKILLAKMAGLAQLNPGKVSPDDESKINELWGNIKSSLITCAGTLSACRGYLESESTLVFLSTVINDIGKLIRDSILLTGETIKGYLKAGK